MIKAVKIQTQKDNTYLYENGQRIIYLSSFNHINIFIGENNSGKSRLLRKILQAESNDCLHFDNEGNDIGAVRTRLMTSISNYNNYFKESQTDRRINVQADSSDVDLLIEVINQITGDFDEKNINIKYARESVSQRLSAFENAISMASRKLNQGIQKNRVYIPVLRGIENYQKYYVGKKDQVLQQVRLNTEERSALEEYKDSVKVIYSNKIAKDYGVDEGLIFTGENLYEEIMKKLLGVEKERVFIQNFQKFISENFYDGESFQLIPIMDKRHVAVKIGNTTERALHDLGDGIKQIICIMYRIFELKDQEALVFIEEPELSLHPGYQRKLMEILKKDEFARMQFFITTHSNHFVDSAFDFDNVSVFKFINVNSRNKQFKVIQTTKGDIELLDILGVNNSSVFMANATIWVEGLSDKIYISKYMDLFMKEKRGETLVEGVDYTFVEYGGNNITHWSFIPEESVHEINASGITNRLFLIVDNDGGRKVERKKKLEAILGNRFLELDVREIENTIKPSVLERTIFPDGNVIVKKRRKYKNATYNNTKANLFEYVEDHYETKIKYWDREKKAVVKNKVDFAKEIADNMNSFEDLSQEAIELCERIYSFLCDKGTANAVKNA